jgi:ribosomal protein S6--L-glutamate ligase
MILSFHPCLVADHQIILGPRRLERRDIDLMRRAEAILLPQTCPEPLYRACKASGARLFPNYAWRFAYPGKVGQTRFFRLHDLPHPDTHIWPSAEALRLEFRETAAFPHALPFLVKTDTDHEGEGIRIVRNAKNLEAALAFVERGGRDGARGFLTQEIVATGGNVLRAVNVGRKVWTYWKRPSRPGELLTTVSRGAWIDFDWRPRLQEKARQTAERLFREFGLNLAAVDLVFALPETDPEPRILEINYAFGRRGLGGSPAFYRFLFEAACAWLEENGMDPGAITLV